MVIGTIKNLYLRSKFTIKRWSIKLLWWKDRKGRTERKKERKKERKIVEKKQRNKEKDEIKSKRERHRKRLRAAGTSDGTAGGYEFRGPGLKSPLWTLCELFVFNIRGIHQNIMADNHGSGWRYIKQTYIMISKVSQVMICQISICAYLRWETRLNINIKM